MSLTDRNYPSAAAAPKAPLAALISVSVLLSFGLLAATLLAFGSAIVPLLAFLAANIIIAHGLLRSFPHSVLGACNIVTLVRVAAVAFLLGAVLAPSTSPWIVFAVAGVAFALDGIDGWLARRHRLTSQFGARFDMEADAALAAVLALWLLASGTTGPEILVLGFTRYAFVLAGLVLPQLRAHLPERFRRKAICVIQIAALLALVCPLTPVGLAPWLSVGAALLLLWSFAVDMRWLLRQPT